jgi:glutamyl-Q tRNA(Asp) synthetase
LPVACNAAGEKLSKQTLAAPINTENAAYHLFQSLQFLGQTPPSSLQFETHQNIWQWAISHWQLAKVANCKSQIIQIQ